MHAAMGLGWTHITGVGQAVYLAYTWRSEDLPGGVSTNWVTALQAAVEVSAWNRAFCGPCTAAWRDAACMKRATRESEQASAAVLTRLPLCH